MVHDASWGIIYLFGANSALIVSDGAIDRDAGDVPSPARAIEPVPMRSLSKPLAAEIAPANIKLARAARNVFFTAKFSFRSLIPGENLKSRFPAQRIALLVFGIYLEANQSIKKRPVTHVWLRE